MASTFINLSVFSVGPKIKAIEATGAVKNTAEQVYKEVNIQSKPQKADKVMLGSPSQYVHTFTRMPLILQAAVCRLI